MAFWCCWVVDKMSELTNILLQIAVQLLTAILYFLRKSMRKDGAGVSAPSVGVARPADGRRVERDGVVGSPRSPGSPSE